MKFVTYIYLPNDEEVEDHDILRKFIMSPGMGRVRFFDDSGEAYSGKMRAFGTFGNLMHMVVHEYSKRVAKRLPTKNKLHKGKEQNRKRSKEKQLEFDFVKDLNK